MIARVSKIYPTEDGFKFVACVDSVKEFVRETKKQAVRARAILIKQLKKDGVKVLCQ